MSEPKRFQGRSRSDLVARIVELETKLERKTMLLEQTIQQCERFRSLWLEKGRDA